MLPDPPARRPHPQPPRRRPRPPAGPARRAHRAERRGQVVARHRHALRRGAAALRRELQPVRAPVPRAARAPADGRARARSPRRSPSTAARRSSRAGRRSPRMADLEPYLAALFALRGDPHVPGLRRSTRSTTTAARRRGAPRPTHDGRRARDREYARRASSDAEAVPRAARVAREGRLPAARRRRRRARHRRACARARRPRRTCGSRSSSIASACRPARSAAPAAGHRGRRGSAATGAPSSRETRRRARRRTCARDALAAHPVVRGLVCPKCARAFEPPRPALFSYNSPLGACEACRGFGRIIAIDWDKVIPDPNKTLDAGRDPRRGRGAARSGSAACSRSSARSRRSRWTSPWDELTPEQRALVLEGEGTWKEGKYPGVRAWFKWLETRTYKMHVRVLPRALPRVRAVRGVRRLAPQRDGARRTASRA